MVISQPFVIPPEERPVWIRDFAHITPPQKDEEEEEEEPVPKHDFVFAFSTTMGDP